MRVHIQFLCSKKTYLLIFIVTDAVFVGQYAFLETFFEWSFFALLFLVFQNNHIVKDPNGLQIWPK